MPINVKGSLLKAKNLARKGDVQAAARLYSAILEQFPANSQARSGLAALNSGGGAAARPGAQPSQRELMGLVGLYNAGELPQALEQGKILAARYPSEPLVHNLVGAANTGLGKHENAIASFRRAIKLKPDYAEAYRNLGAVFNTLDRNREAIDSFSQAIQFEPQSADAHYNLGNACKDCGQYKKALASYETAIGLEPGFAQAYNNLGNVLRELGRHQEALASLRNAIRINPNLAQAYTNLGNVFDELSDPQEAVGCHSKALQVNPDYPEAYSNLGSALRKLGRLDEALESCQRAIALRPAYADAHNNLGYIFVERGDLPQAIDCFAAVLEIRPEDTMARAQMLHLQAHICDWDAIRASAKKIPELGVTGSEVDPFGMLAFEDSPGRHRKRSELYAKNILQIPELETIARPVEKPQRLRIGYFSADFHSHATLYLMIGLIEQHDSDKFAVHAFSYGPDGEDAMRDRLKDAVESFHDVRHRGDREVAELARSEGIDIAIDLKGYTRFGRPGIFAQRAAAIQVSFLGYPGTLGLPAMDYMIADQLVIPEAQRKHYSEDIIYLPHSYQINDRSREISEQMISRSEQGLPEDAFVFCCFNNNYKIGSREFDLWMRLLQQVDDSVLWLLQSNSWAAENLVEQARQRGVDPGRIILAAKLPHAQHLARHRCADLFLDCFNYNAHTTASDALWAGLPIVTLQGQGFAARVASSLLDAVGLPELITQSEQAYAQLALDLASSPERLTAIRDRLVTNLPTAPLFDTQLYARHMERAYQEIYQRYLEGQAPATIEVSA